MIAGYSYCQKHSTKTEREKNTERARKKCHNLSPLLWSFTGVSHWPNSIKGQWQRGPGDAICSRQPPKSKARQGRTENGVRLGWGSLGCGTENNQCICLFTGLQLYILSIRVGDAFYKNEAPFSQFHHLMHT